MKLDAEEVATLVQLFNDLCGLFDDMNANTSSNERCEDLHGRCEEALVILDE